MTILPFISVPYKLCCTIISVYSEIGREERRKEEGEKNGVSQYEEKEIKKCQLVKNRQSNTVEIIFMAGVKG